MQTQNAAKGIRKDINKEGGNRGMCALVCWVRIQGAPHLYSSELLGKGVRNARRARQRRTCAAARGFSPSPIDLCELNVLRDDIAVSLRNLSQKKLRSVGIHPVCLRATGSVNDSCQRGNIVSRSRLFQNRLREVVALAANSPATSCGSDDPSSRRVAIQSLPRRSHMQVWCWANHTLNCATPRH
ncbi:MAG: hypothetical protein E1N59_2989 [Puniceicoccaceae bacterium 5H]|nr:MAG: hypothetical protein E1N59_2989 [Puniceicoccaceae bacterium 5H]